MNYTEKYEVRWKGDTGVWKVMDIFSDENAAVDAMELDMRRVTGSWRVVRVSEVTIAHRSKS